MHLALLYGCKTFLAGTGESLGTKGGFDVGLWSLLGKTWGKECATYLKSPGPRTGNTLAFWPTCSSSFVYLCVCVCVHIYLGLLLSGGLFPSVTEKNTT